jgi:hypothetical protein
MKRRIKFSATVFLHTQQLKYECAHLKFQKPRSMAGKYLKVYYTFHQSLWKFFFGLCPLHDERYTTLQRLALSLS